jgi:general bacterial porin, GBP family
MKKSLVAVAVLGALSGIASAQSAVTIYGIADAGIVNERGGKNGSVTKLTNGVASTSRLGFRGTEDLGGGLSAIFVLEAGVKLDTGEGDSALFGRQAYVGMKNTDLGALTLGRQYTPYYVTFAVADPFSTGLAGSAKNLLPAVGNNTRASNTILYTSPNFTGFSGEVAYSLGEQSGSNSAGRQFGAALAYANGPLNVRLGYNNKNTDVTAAAATTASPAASNRISTNTLLAANYNFNVVKAYAAFGIDKGPKSAELPNATNPYGTAVAPTASDDSRELLLGVAMPFGASTVLASYIRKDDRTFRNQDADQWALGYTYDMSKRTKLYSSIARIKNKNNAGYTVGNGSEVGTGNKAVNIGVRHSF